MKSISLTLILFAAIVQTIAFPVVSSSDLCLLKKNQNTITNSIIKPQSHRSGDEKFNINKLKGHRQASGIISPDKKILRYRIIKPANADPQMVIRPAL